MDNGQEKEIKEKKEEYSQEDIKELLQEYEENPFDPARKNASDIMRIFYEDNISILPVVSRRNVLIGIITKEEMVLVMSDIDRANSLKIDKLITSAAKKMTFEEVLPHMSGFKEFTVINIFGDPQGRWSRMDLLTAIETGQLPQKEISVEIERNKEEQAMEWMIYLILEHLPRPIYAMNERGSTVFYNGYFEELYLSNMEAEEIDIPFLEKSFNDSDKNEYFYAGSDNEEMYFYNRDMKFYYEKIPMVSNDRKCGYLIFCSKFLNESMKVFNAGTSAENLPLSARIEALERMVIIEELKKNENNMEKTCDSLKITKALLQKRLSKLNIHVS